MNLYLTSVERRIKVALPELYRMKIEIKHLRRSDSGMLSPPHSLSLYANIKLISLH